MTGTAPRLIVTDDEDPEDHLTIALDGLRIDISVNINAPESVTIECYAYESQTWQAVVQHHDLDRYTQRHPYIRVELAERRTAEL